jgi:hypothetical protein
MADKSLNRADILCSQRCGALATHWTARSLGVGVSNPGMARGARRS